MTEYGAKIPRTIQKRDPNCPLWHKISTHVYNQAMSGESIVATHDIISVVWIKDNGEEILCKGVLFLEIGIFHRYQDESGCWMLLPVFLIRYLGDELMKENETHSMIFLNSQVAFVLSCVKGAKARYNMKMTWVYEGICALPLHPNYDLYV